MMDFEPWRKRFEQDLRRGTKEWMAFQAWREHLEEFKKSAALRPTWDPKPLPEGHPFKDPKRYMLGRLYHGTLLPSDEDIRKQEEKRKQDEYTLNELEKLATHAESFVGHLWKRGFWVSAEDDYFKVDLTPLLPLYNNAVQSSRHALWLLRRRYVRKPDVIDHCLALIIELKNLRLGKRRPSNFTSSVRKPPGQPRREWLGIPERQVLALVCLALRAHGHNAKEIDSVDPSHVRYGNVRRRVDSRMREVIAQFDEISASMRKQ
jgi:hypothetical protein